MRYSSKRGALTFYNDMRHCVARMVQPPDDYSMRRKFINGLPLSLVEGVVKACGISAEHSAMEQILEVQKMESALKMISNHSRTQAVKSSFRGTGTGVPAKEKSSPENSGNGHKYFCRGNVLYKKALSNARQQRTDGQQPGTRDTGQGTYNRGGGASGKARGTLLRKDTDVSTVAKWGTLQTAAPNQRNKIRPDYLQRTCRSLTPLKTLASRIILLMVSWTTKTRHQRVTMRGTQ